MVDEIAAGSFVAPATATGLLRIAPENGSEHFYGTAWAVGPRTLVTAAHNVYGSFGIRNWIGLALGHNAVGAPARYVSCCGYIVPPSWQSDPSETNPDDYAILLTQQPLALPPSGRNFGLAAPKNDELTGASFNVLGYAGVESNDMRLYWAVGAVTGPTDDPSTFYYEAFNGAGMSGGPIYFESGGDHYAVGVHRGVAPYGSGSVSVARKIGEPTRDEIRWHALNPACPS